MSINALKLENAQHDYLSTNFLAGIILEILSAIHCIFS